MVEPGIRILDAWVDVLHEVVYTLVLETYRIDHSRWRFGHTRVGVAFASFQSRSFDDDAAQSAEVDEVGELFSVAEGSRSRHDRVLHDEFSYVSR